MFHVFFPSCLKIQPQLSAIYYMVNFRSNRSALFVLIVCLRSHIFRGLYQASTQLGFHVFSIAVFERVLI